MQDAEGYRAAHEVTCAVTNTPRNARGVCGKTRGVRSTYNAVAVATFGGWRQVKAECVDKASALPPSVPCGDSETGPLRADDLTRRGRSFGAALLNFSPC